MTNAPKSEMVPPFEPQQPHDPIAQARAEREARTIHNVQCYQAGLAAAAELRQLPEGDGQPPTAEQIELEKIRVTGERAIQAVIEDNAGLVREMARRYLRPGVDREDLIQVGEIAVTKAAKRFRQDYGTFGNYAFSTVNGELQNYLRDLMWPMRIPRRIYQDTPKVIKRVLEEYANEGLKPDYEEIAATSEHDYTAIELREMVEGIKTTIDSTDTLRRGGESFEEAFESPDNTEETVVNRQLLLQVLGDLSDQERKLIVDLYILERPQEEIGAELGIGQSSVSRRAQKICKRLATHPAILDLRSSY